MNLNGVLFLAARTARSQAYAQCMAAHKLIPEEVVIFGKQGNKRLGQSKNIICQKMDKSLFIPDLSRTLEDSCQDNQWNPIFLDCESINAPALLKKIDKISPKLVIYSGYGGEIVSSELLGLNIPFLHIHAGRLPNYRGSTTIYYSILQEQNCAASAILLANDIDTGPIVASKTYPAPPTNIDIDYIYDSAIRADLLVTVLNNYAEHGELPTPIHQEIEEGQDYYIIHPVLKHLAMLSIGNR